MTAFVLGTKRLYDFINDNPMVEMRSVDFTNDSAVIRTFHRMVAINSAIEVDLTGQVVADSIGPRVYSGVGGQMDFMRGAALARGGAGHHRLALDGRRRHGVTHRGDAARRGWCRDDTRPRPDRRDGVRCGRTLRQEHRRAGPRPYLDRPPRLQG